MAADVEFKVNGVQSVREALRAVAPNMRRKVLRPALRAGGSVIAKEAKRLAPVLKRSTYYGSSALRRGVRMVGTLRNAILVRTSKLSTKRGDVGVFINVRPLRGASRNTGPGAKNPKDPYYWRWVEFGWNPAKKITGTGALGKRTRRQINKAFRGFIRAGNTAVPGQAFLRGSAKKAGQALVAIQSRLGTEIQKLNTSSPTVRFRR